MDFKGIRYVVVGAGFFGSVIAERIAHDMHEQVIVIEKRDHIGGNSYSAPDPETGIEVHLYGSHIFHTSDNRVWEYITRFCELNRYHHRVLTFYKGCIYQMPINLHTINTFYSMSMTPEEARELIRKETAGENIFNPSNFEEKALSVIGRPLYEAFIKGYTQKQWGTDPRFLPASILERIPIRFNYESAYFFNQRQGIPLEGYGILFKKMLTHENIDVFLNTDFFAVKHLIPKNATIIFSGPVDSYFNFKYGMLEWRTLKFEREVCNTGDYQGVAVVNYAEAQIPFTRIHEFRHYHPERFYPPDRTVIFKEFAHMCDAQDDLFYPINTHVAQNLLLRYEEEAKKNPNVIFGGRLGSYKYLNMDDTIRQALDTYEQRIKRKI